jgi:hypothetical protein
VFDLVECDIDISLGSRLYDRGIVSMSVRWMVVRYGKNHTVRLIAKPLMEKVPLHSIGGTKTLDRSQGSVESICCVVLIRNAHHLSSMYLP